MAMPMDSPYPGTRQHQALLAAIVDHYRNDPRILAVSVFGSLSRGTWDQYSDIDLDVVIADNVQIDVLEALKRLCTALAAMGQRDAVIAADGNDAGDVVFGSLAQLSIRYHPLATTSPNIVDSLRVLAGSLDHATLAAAGLLNRQTQARSLGSMLDQCVQHIAVVAVAVQRGHLWGAVEMLHRIRAILMDMYALAHGGERPLKVFQAEADQELQARLGRTLPQYDRVSVRRSLEHCVALLEADLEPFTQGQIRLTDAHRKVLAAVRARLSQSMTDRPWI